MLGLVDRVIRAFGAEAEVAASVSDHLVNAEACGVRSHGVARVGQYDREVLVGQIVPTAVPTVVKETDARALLDGNRAFGPFACRMAATRAARMADDFGIGLVTVRQCGHAGRIGAYVEILPEPANSPWPGVRALETATASHRSADLTVVWRRIRSPTRSRPGTPRRR